MTALNIAAAVVTDFINLKIHGFFFLPVFLYLCSSLERKPTLPYKIYLRIDWSIIRLWQSRRDLKNIHEVRLTDWLNSFITSDWQPTSGGCNLVSSRNQNIIWVIFNVKIIVISRDSDLFWQFLFTFIYFSQCLDDFYILGNILQGLW